MREKELWKNVLSSLETELSKARIATFFRGAELGSLEGGRARILCPNRLSAEHLRSRYGKQITKALSLLSGQPCRVSFEVTQVIPPKKPEELGPIFKTRREESLFSSYTFENFVVGLSNQMAERAASVVAEKPGQLHNPLFIYSKVGLGKTHLLHAIGNAIKAEDPESEVLYCPAERFTNELIRAIQDRRSTASFHRKFRSVDVLLVDDIQFLAGREATQEEFFNTFNELYLAQKQIVLTSDRNPNEIPRLEERLVSRFSGGMVTDIQGPDLDLRLEILRRKAKEGGMSFGEEVLLALAEQVSGNIRQLEGSLHQLLSLTLAKNIAPSPELVESLSQNLPRPRAFITPEEIIKIVCRRFSLEEEILCSSQRTKEITLPRQISAYLLRNLGQLSLQRIGELLGGRDHSTIRSGLKKIEKELPQNPSLRHQVEAVRGEILGENS